MARIPDEELSALKRDTPLAALARARGVELSKRGQDLVGRCPFHEEKTVSFVITESKNVFHCFGCEAGGSIVDFLMRIENVSFRHAVELLRTDPLATGIKTGPKLDNPFSDAKGKSLLTEVMSFCRDTLHESPEAHAYLEKRGVLEAADAFNVGFANRLLGLRLPNKNRRTGADIRMRLVEVGIYRGSGHEHLRGSIVIPFFDDDGDVVEMYGRKVTSQLRKGTAHHLYLSGPHRGILNRTNLDDEIVLCEAPIDAMSFYAAGIQSVTSAFGASGITGELFSRLCDAKHIHIAFDNDDAGNASAMKVTARLIAAGVMVSRCELPMGVDANEVFCHRGRDGLTTLFRKSAWAGGKVREEPAVLQKVEPSAETTTPTLEVRGQPKVVECEKRDQVTVEIAGRSYRVRGLSSNTAYNLLKVNVMVSLGDAFHVDSLDLYAAKARAHFAKMASKLLKISFDAATRDIGKLLRVLEERQDAHITKVTAVNDEPTPMSEAEHQEAMTLLQNPQLLSEVLDDFDSIGVIGEEANKLIGYLAAISRKMKKPLAVMVQSSSAAGKSSLMDAILAFVPDEDKVAYSAMTGQSLFYMEDGNLKHKVLAIAEEQGAERASYALKILQSEGKLCIASTGKNPDTGRHTTSEYEVEGPVAIFTTTTAIEVDEELLNRCLVLTVDEDAEQTRVIYETQRQQLTEVGHKEKQRRSEVICRHQNAQRLLFPVVVINRLAPFLTFPSHQVRLRRDHAKYLALIEAIALLHQHQREQKKLRDGTPFVEVIPSDIDLANHLMSEVLARSLDELAPQTRKFLTRLCAFVTDRAAAEGCPPDAFRFARRDVRAALAISATQLHRHMTCLIELDYIFAERQKGERTLYHSLLYRPDDDRALTNGLISGADAFVRQEEHRNTGVNSSCTDSNSTQIPPKFRPNSTHNPTREIVRKLNAVRVLPDLNSDMSSETRLRAIKNVTKVAS